MNAVLNKMTKGESQVTLNVTLHEKHALCYASTG